MFTRAPFSRKLGARLQITMDDAAPAGCRRLPLREAEEERPRGTPNSGSKNLEIQGFNPRISFSFEGRNSSVQREVLEFLDAWDPFYINFRESGVSMMRATR